MQRMKLDLSDEKTAKQGRNQTAITSAWILNLILVGAYLTELLKGTRTASSYFVIVALCLIPSILAQAAYFKKKDGVAVRYCIAVGFSFLYAYIMFTTTTNMAFSYIIIILIALTVYSDTKLTIGLSVAAVLINIAAIIKNAIVVGLTPIQISEAEIMVFCLILAGFFALLAVNKTSKINSATMEKISREKEQSEELLKTILRVAEQMSEGVEEAVNETNKLKESITITKCSMEELSGGASEAVSAIQTQQTNTEEINRHVSKVEQVTNSILEDVGVAEERLHGGQETMDNLIQQVRVSEEASNLVANYMEELRDYADRMQGIMTLISNVASQTGLLALNASIEAARAGEAGRGFAVVASEISNLAGQTSNATGDINALIGNISKSLTEVADSVGGLLNSNKMQNSYVSSTAENFENIRNSTQAIFAQAANLKKEVDAVGHANEMVINSIENVSAVTQEVTANAGETLEGSRINLESVDKMTKIMDSLSLGAEELKMSKEID